MHKILQTAEDVLLGISPSVKSVLLAAILAIIALSIMIECGPMILFRSGTLPLEEYSILQHLSQPLVSSRDSYIN